MALFPSLNLRAFLLCQAVFCCVITRISRQTASLSDPGFRPLALIMQAQRHEEDPTNQMEDHSHLMQPSCPVQGFDALHEGR